jgi:hypothetical protein
MHIFPAAMIPDRDFTPTPSFMIRPLRRAAVTPRWRPFGSPLLRYARGKLDRRL